MHQYNSELEVKAEAIELVDRREASAAVTDEDTVAAQRARRLRRKLLAENAVAQWKHFAREAIAEARARAFVASAPKRRVLVRWRAAVTASRAARRLASTAVARRRFLSESRGFATWVAATREARKRRSHISAKVTPAVETLRTRAGRAMVSRVLRQWQAVVSVRRGAKDALSVALAHCARRRATLALCRWRGIATVAEARRGLEVAALKAWAVGRIRCGLASLMNFAAKQRCESLLCERAAGARARLLGLRGIRGMRFALYRTAVERDLAGKTAAWHARAALSRWRWWVGEVKARRAVRSDQAYFHRSRVSLGRAMRQWRRYYANRQHFRFLHDKVAKVPSQSSRFIIIPVALEENSEAPVTTTIATETTRLLREGHCTSPEKKTPSMRHHRPRPPPSTLCSERLDFEFSATESCATHKKLSQDDRQQQRIMKEGLLLLKGKMESKSHGGGKETETDGPAKAALGGVVSRRATGSFEASAPTISVPAVGRARAAASIRRWRRRFLEERQGREAADLAASFRDHVLLLRHHESWKAFARRGREAAAVSAAVTALGRRARMRRTLRAFERGVEASAAERRRELPLLRVVFEAWEAFRRARVVKGRLHVEEEMAHERRLRRRAIQAWVRKAREKRVYRQRQGVGENARRIRSLRGAFRAWKLASVEMRRRREQLEASLEHARRMRLSAGLRTWRTAAARAASSRAATKSARDRASRNLALRTMAAWRSVADLRAARRAVFGARVSTAVGVLAVSKLRRALCRWREFHGSSRVASIMGLRAEGHARRKVLGKVWRGWKTVRDLKRKRRDFQERLKAFRRRLLLRRSFEAMAAAAAAARQYREKVRAALLLWKLHTQGKAFAALVAYRLRRRWKQDRARRAVAWRRERLVKEGALRWAATADAVAASRISSAAFREGNAAARRWEAVGRCARHWRRVAAARAMQRRALEAAGEKEKEEREDEVIRRRRHRGEAGWRKNEEVKDQQYGKGSCAERGLQLRSRPRGVSFAPDPGFEVAAMLPSATAIGRENVGVIDLTSAQSHRLLGNPDSDPNLSPDPDPASLSPFRRRSLPGSAVVKSPGGDVGNLEVRAPGRRNRPNRELRSPKTATTAISGVISAGDFAHGPEKPLIATAAGLPEARGSHNSRPAPRRPLELLLDEVRGPYGTSAVAEGGGRRGVGGNTAGSMSKPALSPWVVDEMNRLFGVRSGGATAAVATAVASVSAGHGLKLFHPSRTGTGTDTGVDQPRNQAGPMLTNHCALRSNAPPGRARCWRDRIMDGGFAFTGGVAGRGPGIGYGNLGSETNGNKWTGSQGAANVVNGDDSGRDRAVPQRVDASGSAPSECRTRLAPAAAAAAKKKEKEGGLMLQLPTGYCSRPTDASWLGTACSTHQGLDVQEEEARVSSPRGRTAKAVAQLCSGGDDEPAAGRGHDRVGLSSNGNTVGSSASKVSADVDVDANLSKRLRFSGEAFSSAYDREQAAPEFESFGGSVSVQTGVTSERDGVFPPVVVGSGEGRDRGIEPFKGGNPGDVGSVNGGAGVLCSGGGVCGDDRDRRGVGGGVVQGGGGSRDAVRLSTPSTRQAGNGSDSETKEVGGEQLDEKPISPQPGGGNPGVSDEERALEARVAEAERRLRRLQEKAEMRRRAKRELAALHKALASQETNGSSPSAATDAAAAAFTASGGAEGSSVLSRRKASSVPRRNRTRIANDGGDVTDITDDVTGGVTGDVSTLVEESLQYGCGDVDGSESIDVGSGAKAAAAEGARAGRGITSNDGGRRPEDGSYIVTMPSKLSRQETSLANQSVSMPSEFPIEGNGSESLESKSSSRTQLLVRMGLLRARLEESMGSREGGVVFGGEAAVGAAKGGLRPDAEGLWREVEELAKSGGVQISRNH